MWLNHFLLLIFIRSDLIDKTFNFYRAIILNLNRIFPFNKDLSKSISRIKQSFVLGCQFSDLLRFIIELLQRLLIPLKPNSEILFGKLHGREPMFLNVLRSERVLSVNFLEKILVWVSYGAIVIHHNVFQRLHKFSLDITCPWSLDCGIWKTFSTTHTMEKELMRFKSGEERTKNKASWLWGIVVFAEMWQGSLWETKRTPFTIYVLIAKKE